MGAGIKGPILALNASETVHDLMAGIHQPSSFKASCYDTHLFANESDSLLFADSFLKVNQTSLKGCYNGLGAVANFQSHKDNSLVCI